MLTTITDKWCKCLYLYPDLSTSPPNTHCWFFSRLRPVPKGDTFHWVTWKEAFTMAWLFSLVACWNVRMRSWGRRSNYVLFIELYQVSLSGHGHEDDIVAHPDLLSLRPLLGGGVHGPPASLACRGCFIQKVVNIIWLVFVMEWRMHIFLAFWFWAHVYPDGRQTWRAGHSPGRRGSDTNTTHSG